jgi:hypothetical protein
MIETKFLWMQEADEGKEMRSVFERKHEVQNRYPTTQYSSISIEDAWAAY